MEKLNEQFFLNPKSGEIYSRIVWSKRFIRSLNARETESLILNETPIVFINATGHELAEVPTEKITDFWQTELQGHVAETANFDLQAFTNGYCYTVDLWKGKYGKPILILRYFH